MTNYLAIAVLAMITSGAAVAQTTATAETPKYVQAGSGNSLAFTFTQLGAESIGHFRTFHTELRYDPANLAKSSLHVRVTIGSLDTQDAERDEMLKTAELLDTATHPTATYVANSLAPNASGGLEAVGKLAIRGVSRDLRLPLTLKPLPNGFELTGQVSIKRLDFGIGQGDWKSTESVGDEVQLQYKVQLVKAAR